MLYILLEQSCNIINPMADEFSARYKKSSIKKVSIGDDLTIFATPPLFDGEWLVLCDRISKKTLGQLFPDKNTVVWRVTNRKSLQAAMEVADGFSYRVIDNSKVSKETVLRWIEQKLNVPESIAKYIYNRTDGALKLIVEGVARLECISSKSRSVINQYVDKGSFIGIYSIVEYLLGISTNVGYEDIVEFFYEYRNAFEWLKRSLAEELGFYLKIFIASDCGEVSLSSVPEFIAEATDKSIQSAKTFKVTKVLKHHAVVSTELVYFLVVELGTLQNNLTGMERLIKLVRAGGNNVYSL